MLKKILLAVGIFATIVALGSALMCNQCSYDPKLGPHADKMCSPNATVNCPGQHCFTATYTHPDGTVGYLRDCGGTEVDQCPNITKGCEAYSKAHGLATCIGKCCQGDNCNNYSPGNATVKPKPTSKGGEGGNGSSLICNKCSYDPKAGPHADKMCSSNVTVRCPAGKYCYTAKYTHQDGTIGYLRDCGGGAVDQCPNITKGCEAYSKAHDLATCIGKCCQGDNCNNYSPGDMSPNPSTTRGVNPSTTSDVNPSTTRGANPSTTSDAKNVAVAKISILVLVFVELIIA